VGALIAPWCWGGFGVTFPRPRRGRILVDFSVEPCDGNVGPGFGQAGAWPEESLRKTGVKSQLSADFILCFPPSQQIIGTGEAIWGVMTSLPSAVTKEAEGSNFGEIDIDGFECRRRKFYAEKRQRGRKWELVVSTAQTVRLCSLSAQ